MNQQSTQILESVTKKSRTHRREQLLTGISALIGLSLLFRIPELLNASGVHSDAAIVGLQALHMLRGEWSWFIWGTSYQGAVEPLLLAVGFLIAGATPLTMMAVPLIGHLVLTCLAFDVLRKRLPAGTAFLACLPLVFAPRAINAVALYPYRQWCITLLFAGIWLLDGAAGGRRPLLRFALGGACGTLALYLDQFAVQFLPGFVLFAAGCAIDAQPSAPKRWKSFAASALGLLVGLAIFWSIQSRSDGRSPAGISLERLPYNARLFWDRCLPWLLSYKLYRPGVLPIDQYWHAPAALYAIQIVGAVVLGAGIVLGGLSVLIRSIPWEVRRLGGLGFIVTVCSVAGFLLSGMPVDIFAVRYLAPVIWIAPFSLAPVAYAILARRFALGLAPYLVSASIGGWLGYGTYVDGFVPVRDARGVAVEEAKLGEFLRARGIRYAAAQYWLSYRMTFLFRENPIVVPLNPGEDRYPAYRRAFDAAPSVALLFHPSEPRATPEPYEALLRQSRQRYQRFDVQGFTVLIWYRSG